MCEFKPGDDLQAVKTDHGDPWETGLPDLVVGNVYVCEDVYDSGCRCIDCDSPIAVAVVGLAYLGGYCICAFRKVIKPNSSLSIESFLTIKPGQFEGPRRVVEPEKVKA